MSNVRQLIEWLQENYDENDAMSWTLWTEKDAFYSLQEANIDDSPVPAEGDIEDFKSADPVGYYAFRNVIVPQLLDYATNGYIEDWRDLSNHYEEFLVNEDWFVEAMKDARANAIVKENN